MTKECPHCHEGTFGWRELIALDYFTPDQCKACGKLVRNDGVRQFLIFPAILAALLVGIVVFALTPSSLQPLDVIFIILLVGVSNIFLAKPAKIELPKADLPPFSPDPNNDKMIVVTGWNEDELRRIVDDFINESTGDAPLKIEIHRRFDQEFSLTFPEDLSPYDFAALVNYLNYPIDFELSNRSIAVAGTTSLNSDFQGIPSSLVGKKATVYVPEDDRDYTVVHMHSEVGNSFSISLADPSSIWQPILDAKLSSQVRMLVN
jgi:hypothetical protein